MSTNDLKTSYCLAGSPSEQVSAMLSIAADWVAEAVDKERGADVKDPSIYRAHAQKYEVGCRPRTLNADHVCSVQIPDAVAHVCMYVYKHHRMSHALALFLLADVHMQEATKDAMSRHARCVLHTTLSLG